MPKNRILLIEDDDTLGAMIQELFKFYFERDSIVANTPERARTLLAQEEFELVISELFVAGESVLSLAHELNNSSSCGGFIFFSNFEMDISSTPFKYKEFQIIRKPHVFRLIDRISQLMSWSIKT